MKQVTFQLNTPHPLRYLWVFSAADDWTLRWHERLLARRRQRGFDVEKFCTTIPYLDGRWLPFPELDQRWRMGEPKLMRMYEDLAVRTEGRDVLILYNGANLHPEFVRWLNVLKVYTAGDDPESTEILTKPVAPAFDIHLVNNIACLDMYRGWGLKRVHFWPLGSLNTEQDVADITEERIWDPKIRTNRLVLFCEREMSHRRARLNKLAEAFPEASFGGRGWPRGDVAKKDVWSTYRKTCIGWNLHNSSGPVNFRTYELPAFGVMQICDNKQDLNSVFEVGKEVVGFDTIEECIDLTRYYLAHPEEQRAIAVAGWKRWRTDYTPDRIWDRLVKIVEEYWPECAKKPETTNILLELHSRMVLPPPRQTRPILRRIAGRIRRILFPRPQKDQTDLAGKQHWDMIYDHMVSQGCKSWNPDTYDMQTLAHALNREIEQCHAKTVLEVGCGNSVWLGYLAKKHNVGITGVDYSENGCALARARLKAENVDAKVFCVDIFKATPEEIGTFDFIYTLGVVEHFADLDGVLVQLVKFLKPGGILFTEVPNMKSIHGFMSWVWQPELLAKHQILSKRDLVKAYRRLGLCAPRGYYVGLFSLGIVAWEYCHRWPSLAPWVVRRANALQSRISNYLMKRGKFNGLPLFAPFIYTVGQRQ